MPSLTIKPRITATVIQDNLVRFFAYSTHRFDFDAPCSFSVDEEQARVYIENTSFNNAKVKDLVSERVQTQFNLPEELYIDNSRPRKISAWHDGIEFVPNPNYTH